MNNSTKATAILLGNLGHAVLEHMNREGKPAIDIYIGGTLIQQDPWPERADASGQQAEEVVLVVAELEEVNQATFQGLKHNKAIQNNPFVILITVAPTGEKSQQEVLTKRQEMQALVDSFLVLPAPVSQNPSEDAAILEAITKIVGYLANLMLENDKESVLIDFDDVKTVLQSSETGAVGLGRAAGANRALKAVEIATSPPYMKQEQITDAKRVLLQIGAGKNPELEMDELTEMTDAVQEKCGDDSEVIFGHFVDEELGSEIEIFLLVVQ